MIISNSNKTPDTKNKIEDSLKLKGLPSDEGQAKPSTYTPPYNISRDSLEEIKWDLNDAIIITGERGIGKTTLIKEKIESLKEATQNSLYARADSPSFEAHKLSQSKNQVNSGILDLLFKAYKEDVKYIFIDEIQAKQALLKEILEILKTIKIKANAMQDTCYSRPFPIDVIQNSYIDELASILIEEEKTDIKSIPLEFSKTTKDITNKFKDLKVIFIGTPLLFIKDNSSYGTYATKKLHLKEKLGIDLSDYTDHLNIQNYSLCGLSFREYLKHFHNINLKKYSLDEIFKGKINIADSIDPELYFEEYIKMGYYPFSKATDFEDKIIDIINKAIYTDAFAKSEDAQGKKVIHSKAFSSSNLTSAAVAKSIKLAILIAKKIPFKATDIVIANELKCSRNDIPEMLIYLERAGLISCFSRINGVYIRNAALNCFLGNYMDSHFSSGSTQEDNDPSNGLKSDLDKLCIPFFLSQVSKLPKFTEISERRFSAMHNYTFSFSPILEKTKANPLKKTPSVFVKKGGKRYEVEIPIWQFGLL